MSSNLELTIRSSRAAIARVGGGLHLLVRAEPPAPRVQTTRRPVAIALVIDRSGSMAEPAVSAGSLVDPTLGGPDTGVATKLSFVKTATVRLLELMHDGDAVTLVTFDDTVQVVKPMTVLSAATRRQIAAAVGAIETGGSTNVEGGLKSGIDQFSKPVRKQFGCKLVLLSDGQANVGEQRPAVLSERAAGAAHNGVTVSTLGFGLDYNLGLLGNVAEAGNGDFTHVESLESLDRILREEFMAAAEVTARDVEVEIELPEGLNAGTNLNGYRQEAAAGGFKVMLGDLVRPKESAPVRLSGDEITIKGHATYFDASGIQAEAAGSATAVICKRKDLAGYPPNEEVLGKLLGQLPALAEMETIVAFEAGNLEVAKRIIGMARENLRKIGDMYGDAQMEAIPDSARRLDELASRADEDDYDSFYLKEQYDSSRRASKGRPTNPDSDAKSSR